MKTEAALLVQTGTPLVVAEIEIPVLKPGQVLVEITYSGVWNPGHGVARRQGRRQMGAALPRS